MTGKKGTAHEKADAEPTFEEALARLEVVVQELEGKELTLEETLARYEEGSRLVAACTRRLETAEQRIRKIGETSRRQEEAAGQTAPEGEKDAEDGGLPF